jgi:hypothetical protein
LPGHWHSQTEFGNELSTTKKFCELTATSETGPGLLIHKAMVKRPEPEKEKGNNEITID